MSIYQEKADQASKLLHEFDLDCWLTFARETVVSPDPGIELAIGSNVTWPSAFIFAKDGRRIAIVGRYDVPGVEAYGVFPTVISYDAGIKDTLIAQLTALNPRTIGLNYSIDDKTSDGLTVGMYLMLQNILKDTPEFVNVEFQKLFHSVSCFKTCFITKGSRFKFGQQLFLAGDCLFQIVTYCVDIHFNFIPFNKRSCSTIPRALNLSALRR